MDAPRHRFRREDVEGETSSEGLTPVDIKLVSIEDELKTISLSSAIAARDSQALRARVETLESRSGGDIQETLSKVYDHIEAQDDRIEQVFDRLQVLERRLQEVGLRLDNLGEVGRIENLPGLLEQSLVTNLDDLEARFESRLANVQPSGAGADDMAAVRQEIEQKNRELRLQIEKLLEKRQDESVELIENAVRNLRIEDTREAAERELDLIRSAVVELQEAAEGLPTREELERMAAAGSNAVGGAVSEDVEALKTQLADVLTEFGSVREQLSSVKGLFDGGDDWAGRLQESLEAMQKSAHVLEGHQERVDLAVRLVTQLEEKSRGISFSGAPTGAAGAAHYLSPPPGESQLKLTLRDLIREMVKNRVSDLHIKTGKPITARIGRELIQFSTPPLTPADSFHLISSALRPSHSKKLADERDIEFVYQYDTVRLRANVFFDRGNLSATFKMLSNRPPELENLGLPKALSALLGRPSGLILVCGLAGSGRTTTLTASLDFLNRTRQLHLVSLEDRLDFNHDDRRSLVTQRELGADIISFSQGMTRAIGQDSDVIFVSDLADVATMDATFAAIEAGLLVVGAITAQNAEDAIPRLINLFPESERKMRARTFARALQGILALKLFERADGEGQIPASELLIANPTVKRLIEEANLSALNAQVVQGQSEGMQTFAESIERLLETGLIRPEDGARELERIGIASAGPRSTAPPAPSSAPRPAADSRPEAGRASAEVPAAPTSTPPSPTPEAFGEEDTLMNWL